ncbi:hypothetical protein V6N13_084047 [Hibiscus sabdariffa]
MFYGTVVWDPWLIVAQIVCLQCLYYLTLGVFLSFFVGTRVSRMSLVYFFDFATVATSTVTGWCVIASFLLSSIAGAGYMLYLIERAKKCLDFSATLYIIHLFICIMYGDGNSEKFPSHDIDQMFDDKESITKKFLAAFIVFHCFGGAEC